MLGDALDVDPGELLPTLDEVRAIVKRKRR